MKNESPVWTEADGAEAAKAIVSKHVIPTTMYTAGMRYYHQKETLKTNVPVHIHKNGGKFSHIDLGANYTLHFIIRSFFSSCFFFSSFPSVSHTLLLI